jgi:hypothetical protein
MIQSILAVVSATAYIIASILLTLTTINLIYAMKNLRKTAKTLEELQKHDSTYRARFDRPYRH